MWTPILGLSSGLAHNASVIFVLHPHSGNRCVEIIPSVLVKQ